MSRIDKADPKVGNYRATLAADLPPQWVEHLVAVGHDTNGRIVAGAGTTGITGVICLTKVYKAGKRIDVHTAGEVVEFGPNDHTATGDAGTADAGVDLGDAGSAYYGHPNGTVTLTAGAGSVYIGHTVEPHRLILRVRPGAAAS
jgi:hypothetical protein